MKKRTAREWCSVIDEPFATQIMDNIGDKLMHSYFDSPLDMILRGFRWDESPEGSEYWAFVIMSNAIRLENDDDDDDDKPIDVDKIEFNPEDKVELISLGMI